ncbi:MAG: DUF3168 domain-containing protein [Anaerolineales bacterium]
MTTLNADRWLYTQLTTDANLAAALGGRVFVDVAPLGTEYPLAVMTFVAAQQVGNWSSDRIMDNELWQIAVWTDEPNYTIIEPVADRIREVLHKASGSGVIGCSFERQLRMSDPEGYKAIILEFRLFTQ